MSITIKDVAKAARVSIASASRALNGHGSVSPEVRRRVDEAARELNYVPHGGARSLITRRSQALGVLLPDLHGEFISELLRGIETEARAHRMHLLVSGTHGGAEEAIAALRSLRGRVDALLVMSPHLDEHLVREHLPTGIPVVMMNTPPLGPQDDAFDFVTIDNYAGARAMVEHLCTQGCRRIALVAGPDYNFDARERLRGYRDALAELRPGAEAIVEPGDFSEESGFAAARRLLAREPRPDAIFAANDMMAIGCLFALAEAGVAVPAGMALGGFDDIPTVRYLQPSITTLRVRISELGEQAAAAAMRALQGERRPLRVTLPVQLVERESTRRLGTP